MDIEKLERANGLFKEIKDAEQTLESINQSVNFKVYSDWENVLDIEIRGEILELLRQQQKEKVDKLKKEFEEL